MGNYNSIYHKGKYRSGEYAKHLRPFLKRVGNKKWRKEGRLLTKDPEIRTIANKKGGKKPVLVKITHHIYGDKKVSEYRRYKTIKDAQQSLNRNSVIVGRIIKS
jgi:hypothetical protein